GVVHDGDVAAAAAGGFDELAGGLVPHRAGDGQLHARRGGGVDVRVADVVAVTDEGEPESLQRSEPLAQGGVIGQQLAGVQQVGEAVDNRHLSVPGELHQRVVTVGARHDAVD